LRRAHVDGLPVAVQHQHGCFRQYVHKIARQTSPVGGQVFALC
jgi:hypothetical protein